MPSYTWPAPAAFAPAVRRTPSTRPSPAKASKPVPRRSLTPWSACRRAKYRPTSGPRTRSRGWDSGSTITTSVPRWRADAATSVPIQLAPTTARRRPGRRRAEQDLNLVAGVEAVVVHPRHRRLFAALHHTLRQGRPLIGQVPLRAREPDRPRPAPVACALGGLGSRQARADDYQSVTRHAAYRSRRTAS